jgi:hypothetical protein
VLDVEVLDAEVAEEELTAGLDTGAPTPAAAFSANNFCNSSLSISAF